jgi:sugar phosphate isomerase/epimerase
MRGSTITLEDYPVEQALALFRGAGFTSVELWKNHLRRAKTNELRRKIVEHARALGIAMGGFNAVGEEYFQPFTQPEQTLAGLRADMETALALGTRDLLIWEGVAPKGTTEAHWISNLLPPLIELFQQFLSEAKPLGGRVLVEPHPFTAGMSDRFLIQLCDALDPAYFGVTYDFCHYGVGRPKDYVAAIHALGPRIRHIHFSDTDQKVSELHFPPREGTMDIDAMLAAFREIRYAGTMTLDLYGYPTPVEALPRSAARMREACEYLGIAS